MRKALIALLKDESGVTTIEYSLIIALVTAIPLIAYGALGATMDGFFASISDTIAKA